MTKRITWNKTTRDFDIYVAFDGKEEYLGSAPTHPAAEERVNEYALAYLTDTCTYEAAAALVMGRAA